MSIADLFNLRGDNPLMSNVADAIDSLRANYLSAGTTSLFTSSAGALTALHTMAGMTVAANQIAVVTSLISWSASSTSDRWGLEHQMDGVGPGVEFTARVKAAAGSTSGDDFTLTLTTLFPTLTAGTRVFRAMVGTTSGSAPSGSFYSQIRSTKIILLRKV